MHLFRTILGLALKMRGGGVHNASNQIKVALHSVQPFCFVQYMKLKIYSLPDWVKMFLRNYTLNLLTNMKSQLMFYLYLKITVINMIQISYNSRAVHSFIHWIRFLPYQNRLFKSHRLSWSQVCGYSTCYSSLIQSYHVFSFRRLCVEKEFDLPRRVL